MFFISTNTITWITRSSLSFSSSDSNCVCCFNYLHKTSYKGKIIEDFARCAQQKLERALISGPRKTLPSTEVFKQVTDPKPPCPVFGVTIAEYMEWQQSTMPGVKEPKILEILANAVINSKGNLNSSIVDIHFL